jgi:hypothetical protein
MYPRPHVSAAVFSLVLPAIGACSAERGRDLGSWVAEWDTIGDTVVVRTVSGSVWGAPREMVEELAIGVLEGPDELMLGSIASLAVDEEGGIYAFDSQVPALRYYDSRGSYIRTLGREGGGPGEYRDFVGALALRRDGKIVLADMGNTRLDLYDPDGTVAAHWSVQGGFFPPRQGIVADTADHTHVPILSEPMRSNEPMKVGYLDLDPEGNVVDTMYIPTLPNEPQMPSMQSALVAQMLTMARGPLDPSKEHALSPLGFMVIGVNDDYSFDVRWPGGPTVRIERECEPVPYTPEERAAWEARLDWYTKTYNPVEFGSVPDRKLPYAYFRVGERGRIWVRRHVEARRDDTVEPPPEGSSQPPPISWVEREVYDVFEPDGTYLGEAHFPWRTTPLVVRGDTAWGVRRGELDEQYIVRLVSAAAEPGASQ